MEQTSLMIESDFGRDSEHWDPLSMFRQSSAARTSYQPGSVATDCCRESGACDASWLRCQILQVDAVVGWLATLRKDLG